MMDYFLYWQLAAKCFKEIGDDARTFFLEKIIELANLEGSGDINAGNNITFL